MLSEDVSLNQIEISYLCSLIEKDILPCKSNLPKSPNEIEIIKSLRVKMVQAFDKLEKTWQSLEK